MGHDPLRVLLDTHALIWVVNSSSQLSLVARGLFDDPQNSFVVSAVSAMEIATKVRLGKLPEAETLARDFLEIVSRHDAEPLAISVRHAMLAGSLDIPHNDPFDRLLIAQAQIEDLPLLSNEKVFDGFGVKRIW